MAIAEYVCHSSIVIYFGVCGVEIEPNTRAICMAAPSAMRCGAHKCSFEHVQVILYTRPYVWALGFGLMASSSRFFGNAKKSTLTIYAIYTTVG